MYRKAPEAMSLQNFSRATNVSVRLHRDPYAEALVLLQMPPRILTRRQSVPVMHIAPPPNNSPPINAPLNNSPPNNPLPIRQRRMSAPDTLSGIIQNPSFHRSDILRALHMPQLMDLDNDSDSKKMTYNLENSTTEYNIILHHIFLIFATGEIGEINEDDADDVDDEAMNDEDIVVDAMNADNMSRANFLDASNLNGK